MSGHLVNRRSIEKVGDAFRKGTLREIITTGFGHVREAHGEDGLDYSLVFQRAELGPVNDDRKWTVGVSGLLS